MNQETHQPAEVSQALSKQFTIAQMLSKSIDQVSTYMEEELEKVKKNMPMGSKVNIMTLHVFSEMLKSQMISLYATFDFINDLLASDNLVVSRQDFQSLPEKARFDKIIQEAKQYMESFVDIPTPEGVSISSSIPMPTAPSTIQ